MNPRIVQRSVAALASTGVAAALALIPAGGAQAAVSTAYIAGGNVSASFVGSGGGTCDLSSGDDSVTSTPVAFGHGTKHRSADLKATFTNSLDSSDRVTVKGHTDTSLTLKRSHKDLSEFDLTAGGSVKITHTVIGSKCHAQGLMGAAAESLMFTEHKKGWLTLTRDTTSQNSLTESILVNLTTGQEVAFDIFQGGHSHNTSRALLKPGKYGFEQMEVAVTAGGAGLTAKSAPLSVKVKQTLDLHGVFKPLKKKHH